MSGIDFAPLDRLDLETGTAILRAGRAVLDLVERVATARAGVDQVLARLGAGLAKAEDLGPTEAARLHGMLEVGPDLIALGFAFADLGAEIDLGPDLAGACGVLRPIALQAHRELAEWRRLGEARDLAAVRMASSVNALAPEVARDVRGFFERTMGDVAREGFALARQIGGPAGVVDERQLWARRVLAGEVEL